MSYMPTAVRTDIDQTLADGVDIAVGTSTGTKIGTATSQKLALFNATPIIQPVNSTDVLAVLTNLGLRATGGSPPLNLNGGTLTAGAAALSGVLGGSNTGLGFKQATVTFPSDADYTLIQAEYESHIVSITGAGITAGRNLIFPATVGGVWHIINNLAVALNVKTAAGAATALTASRAATFRCNGTDFKRMTADVVP